MTTTSNRRNSIRTGTAVHTTYDCLNDDYEPYRCGIGRALNVSKGGICLKTYDPIDVYDRLSMTIMIEDEFIAVNGRVVYCDGDKDQKYFRSGVEFLAIDGSSKQVLGDYVGSRLWTKQDD